MTYQACSACDEIAETGCEYCSACLATVTEISERINDIRVMLRAPYGFLYGEGV